MSTLIISLPLEAAEAETVFDYVLTHDGVHVAEEGRARAEDLPLTAGAGDERIGVAPVRALSWHRVTLPEGVTAGSTRMRAVLEGLLEDQLLDTSDRLHFALPPTLRPGFVQWVAACDRRWMAMAYQHLEAAQRPVSRIVPEWGPPESPGSPEYWHVTGTPDAPQLVVCNDGGVSMFPLDTAALDWLLPAAAPAHETAHDADRETAHSLNAAPEPRISAEPALLDLAFTWLQRPVLGLSRAERWVQVATSPWDLAKRLQMRKRAQRGKLEWWRAPRWRPARWAAALLVGVNLLGLNALAWMDQRQLAAKQALQVQLLSRTFPNVKTIIDAPVQMARELRLLAQASASPTATDLDVMLAAVAQALPPGQHVTGLDYASGQLRLKGLELSDAQSRLLQDSLQARGYSAAPEGRAWLLQPVAPARSAAAAPPAAKRGPDAVR